MTNSNRKFGQQDYRQHKLELWRRKPKGWDIERWELNSPQHVQKLSFLQDQFKRNCHMTGGIWGGTFTDERTL